MNQQIIDKLNLKATSYHNGQSFVNDITIYLWPNAVKGWKTFLMECDAQGNPLPKGTIRWVSKKPRSGCANWGCVSTNFLLEVETSKILDVLNND